MLSEKLIQEFKRIVKEEAGKELTDEEAGLYAEQITQYYEILYKIYLENKEKEQVLTDNNEKSN
ncbi:hypothetical protein HYV44_02605 [Candidatus Microgenomates bacterium]|nr:hypothetical protein [Candidatus Microgenomates bacterium]